MKTATNLNFRTFIWVFGVFSLLSFTLPIRRPIMDGIDIEWVDYLFRSMPFAAVSAMINIYYITRWPNLRIWQWADKAASLDLWIKLTTIAMPIMLLLFIVRAPGIWWTWTTLGVHIATVVLIAYLLRDRTRPIIAFLIGGAIVTFGAGVWEIAYQIGLYYVYVEPYGVGPEGMLSVIVFLFPMIVGGLAVMWQVSWKPLLVKPSLNKWSLTMFGLTGLLFVTWFLTGFWVDVLYTIDTKEMYYQEEFYYWSMAAYRCSKVTLGLGLAFLYLRRQRVG